MNSPILNINTARRQANCFTKSLSMSGEGYAFNAICRNLFRIFKPENTAQDVADYVVDLMPGVESCTCPDFEKHGVFCKHTLYVQAELKKAEQAEEEAMWKAICEEYELRERYEQEI